MGEDKEVKEKEGRREQGKKKIRSSWIKRMKLKMKRKQQQHATSVQQVFTYRCCQDAKKNPLIYIVYCTYLYNI